MIDFGAAQSALRPAQQGARIVFEEILLQSDRDATDDRFARQLGSILVVFTILAVIPMGSNRAIWWMIEAALIGGLAVLYYGRLLWNQSPATSRLGAHKYAFACGIGVIGFGIFQILPFGIETSPVMAHLPQIMHPKSPSLDQAASLLAVIRIASFAMFFALCVEAARHARQINHMAWILYWGMFAHAVWGIAALVLLGDYALWGGKPPMKGSQPAVL